MQRFFSEFDMFSAPPLLRARKENKISSLVSGMLSFALAITFAYVFIINAHGVITYIKIDSVET